VQDLDGGIKAIVNGTADYFLWEYFTTKPFVDKGLLKRIGKISTPWPCFVLAIRNEILETRSSEIKTIINIINKQVGLFNNPLHYNQLINLYAERYDQDPVDINSWLSSTRWDTNKYITIKQMNVIQNKLLELNVIKSKVPMGKLIMKI
jgi:hypothetical protein